jgi:plastocyanin
MARTRCGRRIVMVIPAVVLSAGLLAACGGNNQSSSPSNTQNTVAQSPITETSSPGPGVAPAQPAGSQIVISNFAYTVPPSVSPGQQVTVVNNDDSAHTVTSDADNLFDVRISGGGGTETFAAPTTPGTYPFHCKYHASMHGTLTVQ